MPANYIPSALKRSLITEIEKYTTSSCGFFGNAKLHKEKVMATKVLLVDIKADYITVDQGVKAIVSCRNLCLSLDKHHGAKGHGRSATMLDICLKKLAPLRQDSLYITPTVQKKLLNILKGFTSIDSRYRNFKKHKTVIMGQLYLNIKGYEMYGDASKYQYGGSDARTYIQVFEFIKNAYDELNELVSDWNHVESTKETITTEIAPIKQLVEVIVPYLKQADLIDNQELLLSMELKMLESDNLGQSTNKWPLVTIAPKLAKDLYTSLNKNKRISKILFLSLMSESFPKEYQVKSSKITINYDAVSDKDIDNPNTFTPKKVEHSEYSDTTGISDLNIEEKQYTLIVQTNDISKFESNVRVSCSIFKNHLLVIQKAKIIAIYNIKKNLKGSERQIQESMLWNNEGSDEIILANNLLESYKTKYTTLYKLHGLMEPADLNTKSIQIPLISRLLNEFLFKLSNDDPLDIDDIESIVKILDQIDLEHFITLDAITTELVRKIYADRSKLVTNLYSKLAVSLDPLSNYIKETIYGNTGIRTARRLSQTDYDETNYISIDILSILIVLLKAIGYTSEFIAVFAQAKLIDKNIGKIERAIYICFLMYDSHSAGRINLAKDVLNDTGNYALAKAYDAGNYALDSAYSAGNYAKDSAYNAGSYMVALPGQAASYLLSYFR